jgi:hypothetical protein
VFGGKAKEPVVVGGVNGDTLWDVQDHGHTLQTFAPARFGRRARMRLKSLPSGEQTRAPAAEGLGNFIPESHS